MGPASRAAGRPAGARFRLVLPLEGPPPTELAPTPSD